MLLILATGRLRLFLETMQDVHGFLKLGDIHHAKSAIRIPDTDLPRTSAHVVEGLPVIRVETCLHLAQLETRLPAGVIRKIQ